MKKEARMINKKSLGLIIFLLIGILIVNIGFSSSFASVSAGELKVTQEHPFLINGQWIEAKDLKVGDYLTTIDGRKARITKLTDVKLEDNEAINVYNLEALPFNDFVVNGIVVHNSDAPSNLPLTEAEKAEMLKFGKNPYPSNPDAKTEAYARELIDKDHFYDARDKGIGPDILSSPENLKEHPELAYGETSWSQWLNAKNYLEAYMKSHPGGEITEDMLFELASKLPSLTVHPSICYTSLKNVHYRSELMFPAADLQYGFTTLFKKSNYNAYKNNPIIGPFVSEGESLSKFPGLLKELMKNYPRDAEFLKTNADNLILANVQYPTPERVKCLMENLLLKYKQKLKTANTPEEIITLAADFQREFVSIHPFNDGNGRISRLLMNYILISKGLPPAQLDNTLLDTYGTREQWILEVKKAIQNAIENLKLSQRSRQITH